MLLSHTVSRNMLCRAECPRQGEIFRVPTHHYLHYLHKFLPTTGDFSWPTTLSLRTISRRSDWRIYRPFVSGFWGRAAAGCTRERRSGSNCETEDRVCVCLGGRRDERERYAAAGSLWWCDQRRDDPRNQESGSTWSQTQLSASNVLDNHSELEVSVWRHIHSCTVHAGFGGKWRRSGEFPRVRVFEWFAGKIKVNLL